MIWNEKREKVVLKMQRGQGLRYTHRGCYSYRGYYYQAVNLHESYSWMINENKLKALFQGLPTFEGKKKAGKSIEWRKKERIQGQHVPENRVREGKHWKNNVGFGDNTHI